MLLFQGEGGNVGPYRKHLDRLGFLNQTSVRCPVELIEIKSLNPAETQAKMLELETSVKSEP